MYYLNTENKLQEYCYDNGNWFQGGLNGMDIQAAFNTSIAAFQYENDIGLHIRVYCQGSWFLSCSSTLVCSILIRGWLERDPGILQRR